MAQYIEATPFINDSAYAVTVAKEIKKAQQ
jgi:hypothetical protein